MERQAKPLPDFYLAGVSHAHARRHGRLVARTRRAHTVESLADTAADGLSRDGGDVR